MWCRFIALLSRFECNGHTIHMLIQQCLPPQPDWSSECVIVHACAFQSTLLGCQVTSMLHKPFSLHLTMAGLILDWPCIYFKFIKTLVKILKVYILFPILSPKKLKFRKSRDRIGQGPRRETRGAVLFSLILAPPSLPFGLFGSCLCHTAWLVTLVQGRQLQCGGVAAHLIQICSVSVCFWIFCLGNKDMGHGSAREYFDFKHF